MSDLLRTIWLSGSMQFCFMPTGAWQTDGAPRLTTLAQAGPPVIPLHIVVEGSCWLRMEGREWALAAGDIVAFPFGTGHQLGVGADGPIVMPVDDLPPKPWRQMPILRYGSGGAAVRILCGYLQCDAVNFAPLRRALPTLLHARVAASPDAAWLAATLRQIVEEVDRPRTGGLSMLERLTEITFIELLRYEIANAAPTAGWLAALGDPALGRCLTLIHDDPARPWTLAGLARAAGLSRTTLTERFEGVLDTSPMRYVREWRLYLASAALATTRRPVAAIADEAGYGTEAAFTRAFTRTYGAPPATWRRRAQPR